MDDYNNDYEVLDLPYKKIEKDGKWNFVDSSGNPISSRWYDEVWDFDKNLRIATVRNGDKINVIDTNGHLISDTWFDDYEMIDDDIMAIKIDEMYGLLNIKTRITCGDIFENVDKYSEGLAAVKKRRTYNFVDRDFNIISKNWFRNVDGFKDGYSIVYNGLRFNLLNKHGELVSEKWYDDINRFVNGYAMVKVIKLNERSTRPKYNYIDENGNLVSNIWFDGTYNFHNGYAEVKEYDKYNYIDTKGEIVFPVWFESVEPLNDRSAIVNVGNKYGLISGKEILYTWRKNTIPKRISDNFIRIDDESICITPDLKDYSVKKGFKSYILKNKNDKIKLDEEPIMIFNDKFILCKDEDELMLYDRKENYYKRIGTVDNITFDDLFIYDYRNGKTFLVSPEDVRDITYDIESYINKERKKGASKEALLKIKEEHLRKEVELERIKEEQRKKEQDLDNEKKDEIKRIQESMSRLKEIDKKRGTITRIDVDDLLENIEDHKEIKKIYSKNDFLRHINLSYIPFNNVKLNGLDLSYTNIRLDPQVIYNKDLSGTNLEGVYIGPFDNYSDVDVRGCKFSDDNDPTTMDGFNTTFYLSLYDETTTYNGIPFTVLYGECNLNNSKTK